MFRPRICWLVARRFACVVTVLVLMPLCGVFAEEAEATRPAASHGRESDQLLSDQADRATWNWLLERRDAVEHVQRDRQGNVQWIGVEGESKYAISIELDDAGRVVKATFNQPGFTDEEMQQLAGFRHLRRLTAWHNHRQELLQRYRDRSAPNPISGAGLAAFRELPLESINFGGSMLFNNASLAAARRMPNLKEFIAYHTMIDNAGLAHLAGDDHIEYLKLGPQFSMRIGDESLQYIGQMKALKHLELNETRLTWEDGLKHLVPLAGQLEKITLKQVWLDDHDLTRLRESLPNVAIEHTPADEKQRAQMQRRLERPSAR